MMKNQVDVGYMYLMIKCPLYCNNDTRTKKIVLRGGRRYCSE